MTSSQQGWCRNVFAEQGTIVAEVYNNKVIDFAMEFYAHPDGSVSYEGLSLFQTLNGAYIGNLLATENEKMNRLGSYLDASLLEGVRKMIIMEMAKRVQNVYEGPFGVDMMVVAKSDGKGFLLNPCVEINLRRTMGHVALALSPSPFAPMQVMRVVHEDNYVLKCTWLEEDIITKQ